MHINDRALDARAIAFDALTQILRKNVALDEALKLNDLKEPRDRAFARALTATILRRKGQIDKVLATLLEKAPPPLIEDLLRLGVGQLLFLGVAPHAVVDQSVEFTRTIGLGAFAKLVNAVLRRVAREGERLIEGQDPARLNCPDWLWQSWCAAYGETLTGAIAAAHLVEAPLDLTVGSDAEGWAARLEAQILFNGTLRRQAGGLIAELEGFDEGGWWVQDLAASLPAQLLQPQPGERIADLCAAPGGKTAQLAASGAIVTALDRSAKRLARLSANLRRLGLTAETVTADAAEWRPPSLFDKILLDAPCSATGTLRRHPDVAWNKRPDDIIKLAASQDRLLNAAADMVKPGGWLLFCSCSLQPEEGVERIANFLARRGDFQRLPIAASALGGHDRWLNDAGDLRSLPCHLGEIGGMDGFYAARLRKDAS